MIQTLIQNRENAMMCRDSTFFVTKYDLVLNSTQHLRFILTVKVYITFLSINNIITLNKM